MEYRRHISMIKTVHSSSTEAEGSRSPKKRTNLGPFEPLEPDDVNTA
jgi:hypothetical protein